MDATSKDALKSALAKLRVLGLAQFVGSRNDKLDYVLRYSPYFE